MGAIKTILKYYAYGCIGSLIMLGFIHIYGMIFDPFYAYPNLEIIIKTPLISGLPFGVLLCIGCTINKIPRTQNRYLIVVLKALTYYWLGFLTGIIILGFTQLYIFVFNEPYYYANIENIIAFAMLLGIPLAILVRIVKKLIDENPIKSIE